MGKKIAHQKPQFIVPFGRNANFVGRDEMLTQLLERIPPSAYGDTCQRTAIFGLGGVGKTQVAIEAAYRVRDVYPDCSVFWVPAVDMVMFENAYRDIGRQLSIQGIEDDEADVKGLVKAALERHDVGSWLLIIDNADDMNMLFTSSKLISQLPSNRRGSILLTTRNRQAAARFTRDSVMLLPQMGIDEATQLLHSGLEESQFDHDQSTAQLLEHLTYLPLAIRQASAYMATNTNVTITRYLEYCRSSDDTLVRLLSKDFEDQGRYEDIQNPIATTWLISFEHISRDNRLAADYLSFMCYLAEKDIPRALLPPSDDSINIDSDMDADEAISMLMAYAFIQKRDTANRFDIHRLVRLIMRNWLRERGKEEDEVTETIYWLGKRLPWPDHLNREVWLAYFPHAQAALQVQDRCTDEEALWNLLSITGEIHELLGKYGEAEHIERKILELKQKVLGIENPRTLNSMNNLAVVLERQGQYEEAEHIHRQTLEIRQKVLGLENHDTLISMNNLAFVLESQGQYEEAEHIYRQTLELGQKVLRLENPDTLISMNNLASVLESQGQYEEAEHIHRQTLELRQKVLGLENPSTLTSMNNLAFVLESQGQYEEAERIHRQTLELRQKVLGLKHPDTLISMGVLADVLREQGKFEEAEQMDEQALELKVEQRDVIHASGSEDHYGPPQGYAAWKRPSCYLHTSVHELREKVLGSGRPLSFRADDNLPASLEDWTDCSSTASVD
nr:uncharacterized protein CTRU02_03292 [Colletotrichum truncatum]KAF6797261.1 hypothetical protein CTRU02_03292 [Colletotrichum truncatum]